MNGRPLLPIFKPMQPVSPELVLVDPELAAAARLTLPDPGDCLALRPLGELARDRVPPILRRPEPAPSRGWPATLGASVAWVALVGILGSSMLAFISPSESARPVLERAGDPDSTNQRLQQGAATIRWLSSPRAAGYSVVLVRGEKRYGFWSGGNRLGFAEQARGPAVEPISPGRYTWFAYPIYRAHGNISFGQAAGSGVVRVPNGAG